MPFYLHMIWFWFDFWCFSAAFSNISAISWQPVLLVQEAGVPGEQGRIQGGRTRRPPPLKLEKIWFFGVKSWFLTRNTPKIFAPPSVRGNFFKCAPPNLKSWIRPWREPPTMGKQLVNFITCDCEPSAPFL